MVCKPEVICPGSGLVLGSRHGGSSLTGSSDLRLLRANIYRCRPAIGGEQLPATCVVNHRLIGDKCRVLTERPQLFFGQSVAFERSARLKLDRMEAATSMSDLAALLETVLKRW
jgi:hypothetical protein